jgi:CelD/BcsL family acetyltransferase involved in cellulose biosynthesis
VEPFHWSPCGRVIIDRESTMDLRLLPVDSLAGVASLAAEWDRLLEASPCNRAFSSPAWFLAACENDPALSPRLLTVRRHGELAGVFPLVVREGSRQATFASGLADYNDLVTAADDLPAAKALLAFARSEGLGYDSLLLRRLRGDSNLAWAAGGLDLDPRQVCPYAPLSGNWEEYLAARSRNFRDDLRRTERRAARDGAVARELAPETDPPEDLPWVFLTFQRERFGDRSRFVRAPEDQDFVARALPRLFAERRVRAFGLFARGELVALDLCMVGPRSLCSWNGGFLAPAAPLSPVKLLLKAEIETACAEGLGELDLLRGAEPYKARWAEGVRLLGSLELRC